MYCDSDHAGCLATRKSTSGLAKKWVSHTIRTSSTTQGVIALSSGEAEFYAAVKAASNAIGMQSMARDLGIELKIRLWVDSTACIGMASRRGVGRIRHLHTSGLWLQRLVVDKVIEVKKVKGEVNPADLFTKHLTQPKTAELMQLLSITTKPSQSKAQLKVAGDVA